MATYRIDLAYDGTGFRGYARQAGVRTVQATLESALFRLTGPVATHVAGRTDAGVHAYGQVVSFSTDVELDTERVERSLNRQCGPEIAVWGVRPVHDSFHARFSAVGRSYSYLVLNQPAPDPFLRHTSWHVRYPLELAAMERAAQDLCGEHDFASLCRRAVGRSTERVVRSARWSEMGRGLLRFDIAASSFCHQMVRAMVALAVDIGRGLVASDAVPGILARRDRAAGRGSAPPHGLTLMEVTYPPEAGGS